MLTATHQKLQKKSYKGDIPTITSPTFNLFMIFFSVFDGWLLTLDKVLLYHLYLLFYYQLQYIL